MFLQFLKQYAVRLCLALTPLILICSGCGKEQTPPLPQTRAQLVLEIFDSFDKEDYESALNKVQRLRSLDETNIFFTQLEHIIRTNTFVRDARNLMNEDKYEEAVTLLKDAVSSHGEQEDLIEALNSAKRLARLNTLVETLNSEIDSRTMNKTADELKTLTEGNHELEKLHSFALLKTAHASTLDAFERDRAIFNLYSEYFQTYPRSAIMEAQLKIEAPEISIPVYQKNKKQISDNIK